MQYAKIGNFCHALSTLSVVTFTIATILHAKPDATYEIFDSDWIQHGFCVINRDVPYYSSHDLCLYFDTAIVAFGLLIYHRLKGQPEMKSADDMMLFNLLGHLGHGIAHGFIAREYRRRDDFTGAEHVSMIKNYLQNHEQLSAAVCGEFILYSFVGIGFWCGLLKGVLPKVDMTKLVFVSALVSIVQMFVRDVLAFTYVQAVLTVAFTSTQLVIPREEKGIFYCAFAVASVMLSIVPWLESTACQLFVARLGGHLIYDVSIAVLLIAAYCISWHHYYSAKIADGDKKKVV